MDSRQLKAGVTGVGQDSEPRARVNPFKRAPAVAVGAALFFAGVANFVFPFASFGGRRPMGIGGEGGPAIMSNDSNIPKQNIPEGVCKVPEDNPKPTMSIQHREK